MADTTALKNRIRAAIKANDNQEITGPVLQQSLLDIVDELNGATETEASARQNADSALGQRITDEIAQEAQAREDAFDDLELQDATGSGVQATELHIVLNKNNGSEQEPKIRNLTTIELEQASEQKAGLLPAKNQWDKIPKRASKNIIPNGSLYPYVKGLAKIFKHYAYPLSLLQPDTVVDSSFFNPNGSISTNGGFKIYKFAVTPGQTYTFSGSHSSAVNAPFIGWADENDNFLDAEGSSQDWVNITYTDEPIIAPANAAYAWFNIQSTQYPSIYNFKATNNSLFTTMLMREVLSSCNLNDVREHGTWLLNDANTYQNVPGGSSVGFLRVSVIGGWVLQEFYAFSGTPLFKRKFNVNATTVEDWTPIPDLSNLNRQIEQIDNKKVDMAAAKICDLLLLQPDTVVDSSFFNPNGSISTNGGFKIYKFAVTPGQIYTFSGSHSSSVNIPFIGWADENDNFLQVEGSYQDWVNITYTNKSVVAPANAAYAWFNIQNGLYPSIYNFKAVNGYTDIRAKIKAAMLMREVLSSCNLNDVREHGTWLLTDSNTYQNVPGGSSVGFLRVSVIGGWVLQEFYAFSGTPLFKRKFNVNATTVEDWTPIYGQPVQNYYTNENTFNEYSQVVNLQANPNITTDTNNYLASSGDNSDRTSDILTMLQATGVCNLGPGVFYVDSLIMPEDTEIIGSGPATKIYLAAGENKFAIRMSSRCVVRNLHILGSTADISVSETIGTRHGILWQGNYTQVQDSSRQPLYATLSDLYISRFSGGGVTCYDTGYGTHNYIATTNCHIWNCCVGVNISYWSEFHKFTNVRCNACWYGCINNGGNNVFVNCDFSSSRGIAFLMDNSQGQSPNNSHGSCVGCVFNHTASNTGVGIKILNCDFGFIFTGCQIFFSKIHIEDSDGVVFSSCNFGQNNCDIYISGGGAVLFANNLHQAVPPSINIVDNNKVHFVNCYVRNTGALVTN